MAIGNTSTRRAGPYATNGVQVDFPFEFKVFDEEDVLVTSSEDGIDTTMLLTTGYTVALNADQDVDPGGTVTLNTAPDGPTIIITSNMAATQPTVFTNSGGFFPRVLNDALDRAIILIQQILEKLTRVPLLPLGDPPVGQFPVVLPGGSLGWSTGTGGGDASLRTDLAGAVGAGYVGKGDASVLELLPLTPQEFGAAGDGLTDDTEAFVDFAAEARATGSSWHIPPGQYALDPAAPIDFTTGGVCEGELVFERSNANATIRFIRDDAGEVLDATAWTMDRGTTDVGATDAENKVMYLYSDEVLIERDGGTPYTKQELVKVGDDGTALRPLVHTYTTPGDVIATAYDMSPPAEVSGLRIRLTGAGSGATLGALRVERDNMRFSGLLVTVEGDLTPATGAEVGVSVYNCYNPVFLNPVISGFTKDGLGYGILFSGTLAYVIHNGQVTECRHAIAGRHNTDGFVDGGVYEDNVDDHWGDNWHVRAALLKVPAGNAGVHYAGNDLRVVDCVQYGGRSMVSIRSDTPHLGGRVEIVRPKFYSTDEVSNVYGVLTLLNPFTGPFTTPPRMPDSVLIDSPVMHADTAFDRYFVFIGAFDATHVNWGSIYLQGAADFNGDTLSVVAMVKDSTYQTTRGAYIEIDGNYDAGLGSLVFVDTADTDATRAATITIKGGTGGLRMRADSVLTMTVDNSTITDLLDDGAAVDFTTGHLFIVRNTEFTGGAISDTWRQLGFFNCQFTGTITEFPATDPATSLVTLVGCAKAVVQPALPTNITTTLEAPFDA